MKVGLGGVSLDDVSEGRGNYPSILSIVSTPTLSSKDSTDLAEASASSRIIGAYNICVENCCEEGPTATSPSAGSSTECENGSRRPRDFAKPSFVEIDVTIFTSTNSPLFPGYRCALAGTVRAASLVLRHRWIDELIKFVTLGPLGEMHRITSELKYHQSTSRSALLSSLYASAIQVGKDWIQDNSWEQSPVMMPLLDICVENFVVTLPESSSSSQTAVFELGHFRIKNEAASRTAVNCSLDEMKAYTCLSSSPSQSLIGGMSCTLQIAIGATTQLLGHVTRLAVAVNESQLAFFAHFAHQNMREEAVVCTGDILPPVKRRPLGNGFLQGSFCSIDSVVATVSLEGVSMEFLQGDGSYIASTSGENMYQLAGTLPVYFVEWNSLIELIFSSGCATVAVLLPILRIDSFYGNFTEFDYNSRFNS